jgi:serine/threonine protein kinase
MGEVYRARDTKLNRDVALKVPPAAFTHDVDRLARFTREAHLLASLNHPHIAAIYSGHHGWRFARGCVAEDLDAAFSADGRYVAYQSAEGGPYQVYVEAFPDRGGRRQISRDGGSNPY